LFGDQATYANGPKILDHKENVVAGGTRSLPDGPACRHTIGPGV
jgi:hypothetical protein